MVLYLPMGRQVVAKHILLVEEKVGVLEESYLEYLVSYLMNLITVNNK